MNWLKSFKWNAASISLGSILLGVILAFWPAMAARTVCYLLSAELLLGTFGYLLSYFSGRRHGLPSGSDLMIGLLLAATAVFVAVKADTIIGLVPLLMGAVFAVQGTVRLQRSMDLKKAAYRGWGMVMLYALLTIGFGVVLLFNPFQAATVMIRVLGIGLFISGFSDIVTMISVTRQVRRHRLIGVAQTGEK